MADISLSREKVNWFAWGGAVACPVLALAGQRALDHGLRGGVGAALLGAAVVAFLVACSRLQVGTCPEAAAVQPPVPWLPVALAAALGALAFARLGQNTWSPDGTVLWLAGLLCLGVAARGAGATPVIRRMVWPREGVHLRWRHVALLGVVALGAFYRLFRIHLIPLEMGPDLPHNHFNIAAILRGEFPIFFPSYPGREGLFFYVAAIPSALFGLSHTSIKVAAALVGVATLPVMYLLGRELYDREVGLLAAFFMAVGHWHVIMTRIGYRNSMVPLMLALMWYFVTRGLRTGRRPYYALGGLCLGLGMYTYNAFMIVPLAAALLYAGEIAVGRGGRLRANAQNVALFAMMAVLVFIPLGRYAYDAPGSYGFRAATRITGAEVALPANLLAAFVGNVTRALLMFNVRGDSVFIANVPYMRQLGFVAAALFLPGVAWLIWRWRRGYNLQVLVMLGVMLLPTALSLAFPNEVPSAIRGVGALPAAVLISALALALLRRALVAGLAGRRGGAAAVGVLLAAVLTYEAVATYPLYFRDYVAQLPDGNYSITLAMAKAINGFGNPDQAYIVVWPHWYDGNAVQAQMGRSRPDWQNDLYELRADAPPLQGPPGTFMVIVHPQDVAALSTLREAFPRGVALSQYKHDGSTAFITYYGER